MARPPHRAGTCENCFNREFAFRPRDPQWEVGGDDEDGFSFGAGQQQGAREGLDAAHQGGGWRMETNEEVLRNFK